MSSRTYRLSKSNTISRLTRKTSNTNKNIAPNNEKNKYKLRFVE